MSRYHSFWRTVVFFYELTFVITSYSIHYTKLYDPFGTIRLKTKGSDGGHNGLKDVQDKLQTSNYNRFRFGISDEFPKGQQVDYVLGEWTEEESKLLKERLEKSIELIKSFGTAGISITRNNFV